MVQYRWDKMSLFSNVQSILRLHIRVCELCIIMLHRLRSLCWYCKKWAIQRLFHQTHDFARKHCTQTLFLHTVFVVVVVCLFCFFFLNSFNRKCEWGCRSRNGLQNILKMKHVKLSMPTPQYSIRPDCCNEAKLKSKGKNNFSYSSECSRIRATPACTHMMF